MTSIKCANDDDIGSFCQMVTFEKNPYDWADEKASRRKRSNDSASPAKKSEINSAVLRLDLTYKDKPFAASDVKSGLGVTVPTRLSIDPKSFTNATLSDTNNYTAVISVKRVSAASVVQLYIYVGKMVRRDFEFFKDLRRMPIRTSFIFSGYVNITLFHGDGSDALKALEQSESHLFAPVWLYNFRFVISNQPF